MELEAIFRSFDQGLVNVVEEVKAENKQSNQINDILHHKSFLLKEYVWK